MTNFSDAVHDASIGEWLCGDSVPVDISPDFDPSAAASHEASIGEWLCGDSQAVHAASYGDLDAASIFFED